jgi:cytochrome P450
MGRRAEAASEAPSAGPRFDEGKLEEFSWKSAAMDFALSYPVSRWWMGFLRFFTPVVRVPLLGWQIVLRHDEVREVLSLDRQFPVPWGWKMVQVTGGSQGGGRNFVLGMARDAEYRLSYEQLAEAFPLSDVKDHVIRLSREAAENILVGVEEEARRKIAEAEKKALQTGAKTALKFDPEFDAVQELVTAVPTELCETYYGLRIGDQDKKNEKENREKRRLFAKWTLAISSYLFGPPFERPAGAPSDSEKLALAAAECLRDVIRGSIKEAKSGNTIGVVLPRLLEMQKKDARITDDVIHAQLFGMVMGFIPTDVLAGGNILDTLLKRADFLRRTRAAAIAGDDELLWRCLRETLRFRNINGGPFRVVWGAGHTLNRGAWNEYRFKPGSTVLASTQAAMFDSRRVKRPYSFDPDRPDEDYLMFSVGQHWCLGAYIAIAQITQTFKPLLKRDGLAAVEGKSGRMQRFTVFPLHLHVRFDRKKP